MSAAVQQEPESAPDVKAAGEAMVSFKLSDVKQWVEWLQSHEGYILRAFTAVEELAEDANQGCRAFNQQYCPDNVHERYDEPEGHRNDALQSLRFVAQTERLLVKLLDQAIHAHYLANKGATR